MKEKIIELFEKYEKLTGVGQGYKVIKNETTDKICITFYVEKKVPTNEVPIDEILPDFVEIDGEIIPTDVVEVPDFSFTLSTCDDYALNNCYRWYPTIGPNAAVPNRNTIRPLQGGVSITSRSTLGGVGTLGFLAVDKETNALVGVTNDHVIVGDPFFTAERDLLGLVENEYGSWVCQSGENPSLDIANPIGYVVRYAPLKEDPAINYVDGALCSLRTDIIRTGLTPPASWSQLAMTGITAPMQFANASEIDALLTNPPREVKKSGRTTGIQQGPCGMKIASINSCIRLNRRRQTSGVTAKFCGSIIFTRLNTECPWPIYGGDSGSALVGVMNDGTPNGTPKIIGLNFAGAINGRYGVANRIDKVAEELSIKPWDGINHQYIDNNNFDIFTIPRGSYDATMICSGKTYWQIGLTTFTQDCDCINLTFTFNPTNNLTVGFDIFGTSNFTITVNWGDGTTTTLGNSSIYNLTHNYSAAGTYQVQVGFSDCSLIQTIQVNNTINPSPSGRYELQEVTGLDSLQNLKTLWISSASLFNFNSLLPNSLQTLVLQGCEITSFNPTYQLPTNLTTLNLNNNILTSVNPTVLSSVNLVNFSVQNNLLDVNNVNDILNFMDTITYISTPPRFLSLNLQTPPAPPSGAAITSVANLTLRDWIVSTD